MKISFSTKQNRAMTLIEVFVVVVVVGFLTIIFLGQLNRPYVRSTRIQCVNNLKQIGLAARVWEGDNGDKYTWQIPATNRGTMDFITGPNTFRHLQVMSNELSTPKVVICPKETDRSRFVATNFTAFCNSNVSFFIGVDADETNPMMILAGDHNITNGMPVRNGILNLTTNHLSGWTAEVHNKVGNIAMADGSVEQVSIAGLQTAVANTGVASNRLQMPILAAVGSARCSLVLRSFIAKEERRAPARREHEQVYFSSQRWNNFPLSRWTDRENPISVLTPCPAPAVV